MLKCVFKFLDLKFILKYSCEYLESTVMELNEFDRDGVNLNEDIKSCNFCFFLSCFSALYLFTILIQLTFLLIFTVSFFFFVSIYYSDSFHLPFSIPLFLAFLTFLSYLLFTIYTILRCILLKTTNIGTLIVFLSFFRFEVHCSGKKNCLNFMTTTFHQHKTFRTYPGQSKKYFLRSFDKCFTH